jgi:ABC-type bacteriocin/lantibiotic exporter with double-glycine peptidase domain
MRRIDPTEIDDVRAPAVLHLRRGHYVVFEGRSAAGMLRLHDPSLGLVEQSRADLSRSWSGWVLEVALSGEPGPPPGGDNRVE